MSPEMFDDLPARVGPRITKQQTWYREPLEPGMKLALTLRHLAPGSKYASMKFGWRVRHNTQSLLKYMDEVMICPTLLMDGVPLLTSSMKSGPAIRLAGGGGGN